MILRYAESGEILTVRQDGAQRVLLTSQGEEVVLRLGTRISFETAGISACFCECYGIKAAWHDGIVLEDGIIQLQRRHAIKFVMHVSRIAHESTVKVLARKGKKAGLPIQTIPRPAKEREEAPIAIAA